MTFMSWKCERNKQIFFGITITICLIFATIVYQNRKSENNRQDLLRNVMHSKKLMHIEDILLSSKKPKLGKSIFFHETSQPDSAGIYLTSRQACAIESAALNSPNFDIYVLFTSRHQGNQSYSKNIDAILSYPNVNIRALDIWSYAMNTPAQKWLEDSQIFNSKYVQSHTSDFLRYLSLYRWGGTYLDLDVVVTKSLENIGANYAGAESITHVAAGVINLDYQNLGRDIAGACLRDFQLNYDGSNWGTNGPGVITRVLKKICKTESPQLMTRTRCAGFKVFSIDTFYAVPWQKWHSFFDASLAQSILNMTSNSVIVHLWNRHSMNELIPLGVPTAYSKLAEIHCPRVFKTSNVYFK